MPIAHDSILEILHSPLPPLPAPTGLGAAAGSVGASPALISKEPDVYNGGITQMETPLWADKMGEGQVGVNFQLCQLLTPAKSRAMSHASEPSCAAGPWMY